MAPILGQRDVGPPSRLVSVIFNLKYAQVVEIKHLFVS